jgi:hypothetical protein
MPVFLRFISVLFYLIGGFAAITVLSEVNPPDVQPGIDIKGEIQGPSKVLTGAIAAGFIAAGWVIGRYRRKVLDKTSPVPPPQPDAQA